jgi:dienelactone hydrolase
MSCSTCSLYLSKIRFFFSEKVAESRSGHDLRCGRNPIRGKVGTFEAIDQIEAARSWAASKSYVDPRRIGIWGW